MNSSGNKSTGKIKGVFLLSQGPPGELFGTFLLSGEGPEGGFLGPNPSKKEGFGIDFLILISTTEDASIDR